MFYLVRLFLLEEIRLRRSFSSSLSLIIFPEMILMGALTGYIFMPELEGSFTYEQVHMGITASLFMFGISMGGIAFLGKEFIERSLGPVTMFAASTSYHPVDEKRMYLSYYLHDIIFYLVLVLAPLSSGIALGTLIRPIPLERFLLISSSQWLTFLLGLSLSMLVSSLINHRKRKFLLLAPLTITPLVGIQLILMDVQGFIPTMISIKEDSWTWLFISLVLVLLYTILGIMSFDSRERENRKPASGSYSKVWDLSRVLYPRDTISRSLFAREIIGIIRGKAYIRIGFSIIFPLLVMSGMIGLISGLEGLPVRFNLTFFAVMVSFFTISIYTHLSNIDFLDFDQTIPVKTPDLIRVKLKVYLVLSIPISLLFLISMSLAIGDIYGLIFGIPLILVAVPYMGYVTAYLTGLWTNSLIFDSSVFMRYMVFTVLPLMFSTMLSFLMVDLFLPSVIGISVMILMGAAAIIIISRGLEKRWKDTIMSSAGTGFRE